MTHKPSPNALKSFLASNVGLARIGTWDQLKEKLKAQGQSDLGLPSYAMNLIIDEELVMSSYVIVPTLPDEGKEGILYITEDGEAYVWNTTSESDVPSWLPIAGGSGGTTDFNALINRPTYNGQPITGSTNIVTDPVDGGEI